MEGLHLLSSVQTSLLENPVMSVNCRSSYRITANHEPLKAVTYNLDTSLSLEFGTGSSNGDLEKALPLPFIVLVATT